MVIESARSFRSTPENAIFARGFRATSRHLTVRFGLQSSIDDESLEANVGQPLGDDEAVVWSELAEVAADDPADHHDTLKHDRLTSEDSISTTITSTCCSRGCLQLVSFSELQQLRHTIHDQQTERDKSLLLLQLLQATGGQLRLFERTVCQRAFLTLLGISYRKFDRVRTLAQCRAAVLPPHANTGKEHSVKTSHVIVWLEDRLHDLCDRWVDTKSGNEYLLLP